MSFFCRHFNLKTLISPYMLCKFCVANMCEIKFEQIQDWAKSSSSRSNKSWDTINYTLRWPLTVKASNFLVATLFFSIQKIIDHFTHYNSLSMRLSTINKKKMSRLKNWNQFVNHHQSQDSFFLFSKSIDCQTHFSVLVVAANQLSPASHKIFLCSQKRIRKV